MYKKIVKNNKLNRKLIKKLVFIFVITILYIVFTTSSNIKEVEVTRVKDINNLLVESYSKVSNNLINQAYENGESISLQVEELLTNEDLDYYNIQKIIKPALLYQDGIKGIYVLLKDKGILYNPYWFKEDGDIKYENVYNVSLPIYSNDIYDMERNLVQPQICNVGGKNILLTTLEIPIKYNGEVVGKIGIDLASDFFDSLSSNIRSIEGMEVAIVSYKGMIISHSDKALVGQTLFEQEDEYLNLEILEIVELMSEKTLGGRIIHTRFNMGKIDQQWYILVTMPESLTETKAKETNIRIGMSGLLALTIIIILSSVTVNKTLRPIHEVCEVLDSAYNGNLSVRTLISSGDEMENIGKGLNDILKSLEDNKKELENEVIVNKDLNVELEELMKDNDRIYFDTIRSLVNTIEAKDLYTGGHCDRVTKYALLIGKKINLSKKDMSSLNYGAILHDIGKIGISENILCKVDRLTNEEFDQIKEHPKKGFEIVKDIHFLKDSKDVIIHHHERYDGSGYPDGLVGENIDLLSRIVTISDAYDAMTTSRSYRKELSKESAIEELISNKGSQFDPLLVDVFIDLLNNGESL